MTALERDDDRRALAAQQAELLSALLAGGQPPTGFDLDRLRAQSNALLAKRRRVVTALRPELAAELGERLPELFESYGRNNPRRTGTSASEDAAAFLKWLRDRGVVRHQRRWWRWWSRG